MPVYELCAGESLLILEHDEMCVCMCILIYELWYWNCFLFVLEHDEIRVVSQKKHVHLDMCIGIRLYACKDVIPLDICV
jgi:hypothetical protein